MNENFAGMQKPDGPGSLMINIEKDKIA